MRRKSQPVKTLSPISAKMAEKESIPEKRERLMVVKSVLLALLHGVSISKEGEIEKLINDPMYLKDKIAESIRRQKSLSPKTIKDFFSRHTLESDREILRRDSELMQAAKYSKYDQMEGGYLSDSIGRKTIGSSRAAPFASTAAPPVKKEPERVMTWKPAPQQARRVESSTVTTAREVARPRVEVPKPTPAVIAGYGGGGFVAAEDDFTATDRKVVQEFFAAKTKEPAIVTGQGVSGFAEAEDKSILTTEQRVKESVTITGQGGEGFVEAEAKEPTIVTREEAEEVFVEEEAEEPTIATEEEDRKDEVEPENQKFITTQAVNKAAASGNIYESDADSTDIESDEEDKSAIIKPLRKFPSMPTMLPPTQNLALDDISDIAEVNAASLKTIVVPLPPQAEKQPSKGSTSYIPPIIEKSVDLRSLSAAEMRGKPIKGFGDTDLMHAFRVGAYHRAVEVIFDQQQRSGSPAQSTIEAAQNFTLYRNDNEENPIHLSLRSGDNKMIELALDYLVMPLDNKRRDRLLNHKSNNYETSEGATIEGKTPLKIAAENPIIAAIFESRGIKATNKPSPNPVVVYAEQLSGHTQSTSIKI